MYNCSMHEIAGNIQNLPIYAAYACAAAVGVCIVGAGAFRVARECARGGRKIAAASLVGAMLIGGMVVVGTDDAGSKPGTNDVSQVGGGTNQIENGKWRMENAGGSAPILRSPFSILHLSAALPENVVTDQDISNRWRVVSVLSNSVDSSIFTFPSAAIEQSNNQTIEQSPIVWEAAQRRGAVFGAWHIPLEGWNFPFDDHGWSNAFMRCEGVLRDSFRDASEQIRFFAPFALCPAANWSRYNLSASRAWFATNELGGLTVAVENGALGNDSSKIASARLDLDPSLGEIRLRYDLSQIGETAFDVGPTVNGTNAFVTVGSNTSEVVFRRVHPEDWDYDGLPNDLDPDPRVPDVGASWNQSDAWAMLAYPSNAMEIASVGYAAWVAARAADPNRRLVGFTVASANGNWPVRLTVDDVPVLCDGRVELKFALDCGAKYAIKCDGGAFALLTAYGSTVAEVDSVRADLPEWAYPYEFPVGDFTVHLASPREGWICCLPNVDISLDGHGIYDFGHGDGMGGIVGHFTPGSTHVLTGEVHQCHSNAFIDCTWSGGPGFSFADPHSLVTEVTWTAVDASVWATNFLSLVTRYEGGYSLTNVVRSCVGPEHVPPTGFSLSCQDVLFLNDDRRLERIYPVNVSLTGTNGVSGAVTLECNGADSKLAFDPYMDAPTNRLEFAMGVEEGDWFMSGKTVYLSCAQIGNGRVDAAIVFTNGTSCTTSATFRVIEPLRKLVTTERVPGQILNPSCLVHGTNALLKVGMRGELGRTNVVWNVVDGPGHVVNTNGFTARVEATATNGTVVVEARFNQDEIQPRFVLPVVMPRELNVKAFVVEPPAIDRKDAWTDDEIEHQIKIANVIFSQVGIRFNLQSITHNVGSEDDWELKVVHRMPVTGWEVLTWQVWSLLDTYDSGDCIEIYFVGRLLNFKALGFYLPTGVVVTRSDCDFLVAHEIGHALGLHDCYVHREIDGLLSKRTIDLPGGTQPIAADKFADRQHDWLKETGRGFYAREDSWRDVVCHFLMHGMSSGILNTDIPYGKVKAFHRNSSSSNDVEFVSVGVDGFKQKDSEVYTK